MRFMLVSAVFVLLFSACSPSTPYSESSCDAVDRLYQFPQNPFVLAGSTNIDEVLSIFVEAREAGPAPVASAAQEFVTFLEKARDLAVRGEPIAPLVLVSAQALQDASQVFDEAAQACGLHLDKPRELPPPSSPAPQVGPSVALPGDQVSAGNVSCFMGGLDQKVACDGPHDIETFQARTVTEDGCWRLVDASSNLSVSQSLDGSGWVVSDSLVRQASQVAQGGTVTCVLEFTGVVEGLVVGVL